MEAGKSTLVVLATFFIATECRSPPVDPGIACKRPLDQCTSIFTNNPIVAGALFNANHSALFANVDEICSAFNDSSRCLWSSLSECSLDTLIAVLAMLSAGDYLCSDEVRQVLVDQQDNVCFTDAMKPFQLSGEIRFCRLQGAKNTGGYDPCRGSTLVRQCILQVIARECGESLGELASEVYDRLAPAFIQTCDEYGPGGISRRFYDMYRKRFV